MNVVNVPMSGILAFCAIFSFAIATVAGLVLLYALNSLQIRQHAYEDAPQTHRVKTGTPTMGGIVFVVALVCAYAGIRVPMFGYLVALVAICAAIGAVDDVLTIRGGSKRGLRARTKFLTTALAAAVFLRVVDGSTAIYPRDVLFHAGTFWLTGPHWLWLLLGICAVTGTIHAVNLTDGLDGLAAGTIVPPLVLFAVVGFESHVSAAWLGASVGVGACLAFLLFNLYPAKMFMGDTGSLALGALLSGVAILSGEMLLLLVAGAVFVAEALSVMLQVSYFKLTGGKRIFRMSPLHHHFELSGWRETKVTTSFWLASLLCSLIGWAIVR